jgi:hypothetical protein
MKLYAVIYSVGGFAKEDVARPGIAGVYSNMEVAEAVKKAVGYGASVVPLVLDEIGKGYIQFAKEMFNMDLEAMLASKMNTANCSEEKIQFREFSELDKECLMSAEEFLMDEESGTIIDDDGCGYWATLDKVSDVSCFSEKPDWATHVCWYNK